MKKTLIYALSEGLGGVEEFVCNLTRYGDLPSDKYGYVVLGNESIYEKELSRYGVEIYHIPKKKHLLKNIKITYETFKKLQDRYDTIYFNTSGLYYPVPYYFAKLFHFRIVLHSHLGTVKDFRMPIHLLNRSIINKIVYKKLACSTPAAEWMFGKKAKDVIIVPNAIDLSKFVFDEKKRRIIREKYKLSNSFVVGNVGRLHPVKNQSKILDIVAELIKDGHNVKALLVGDGEDYIKLVEQAKQLGIDNRVVFSGRTNSPQDFMCAMDCFVMPSINEGFPITLIEAQSIGLPCVVSNTITKEVNVTGHVKFASLSDELSKWCKLIIDCYRYNDGKEVLQKKGYDVHYLEKTISDLLH